MPSLTSNRLKELLAAFRRAKVLVIGDLMLDEFVWGKVSRISPEAPVPVVWVQSESLMPGGAENMAHNVRALGGSVQVIGVLGTDRWGTLLLEELAKRQVETSGLVRDAARPTTVKTRVIAHHQQVVRVDREDQASLTGPVIERVVASVRQHAEAVDAIIIEDYGKGVVTRRLLEAILPWARSHRKIVTVDPKEEHFDLYRQVTAITPNRAEAGGMVGRALETEEAVMSAGEELLRRQQCEGILVTLGEDGMCLFEQSGRRTRIPTVAQEVFDVAGAGDTVIGTFTLALAAGASMPEAAVIANQAAGIVVGKVGVAVTSPEELLGRMDQKPGRQHTPARREPEPGRAAGSRQKLVRKR